MKKARVELHPESAALTAAAIKAGQAAFRETLVEITANGRKFTPRVEYQKGSPQNPMTDDELKEKFRKNAHYCPGRVSSVEEIIQTVDRLENLPDITELTRLLTAEI